MTQAERRFCRLIHESVASTDNKFSEMGWPSFIAIALSGGAIVLADWGFGYAPRIDGHILAPLAFFPAIVAASRFGGRAAKWIASTILVFVEALFLPHRGLLWIEPEYVLWYLEFAAVIYLMALLISSGGREPHAADKRVRQGKRLGIIRNWFASLFSFS